MIVVVFCLMHPDYGLFYLRYMQMRVHRSCVLRIRLYVIVEIAIVVIVFYVYYHLYRIDSYIQYTIFLLR